MERSCLGCGVVFVPKNARSKFCGLPCAWANIRLVRVYTSPALFWARVDKTSSPRGCWLWTGTLDKYGYGEIAWNGARHTKTHRLAWLLMHGSMPPRPACVLHRCDVRNCCNIAHLFAGPRPANSKDMAEKDRGTEKVTNAEVREMRRAYRALEATQAQLAARYGITERHVGDIIRGRARYHVAGAVRTDGRAVRWQRHRHRKEVTPR